MHTRYLVKNVTFDFKFGQIFEILFIFLDTKHGKINVELKTCPSSFNLHITTDY